MRSRNQTVPCTWEFLSDPQNQATLGWIAGGLVAVLTGIWTVIQFFWLHHAKTQDRGSASKAIMSGIGLTSVSIVTGLVGLVLWAREEIAYYCPDCWAYTQIDILSPSIISETTRLLAISPVLIEGDATPHRLCRIVTVLVHDLSGSSRDTICADQTQTDGKGRWGALAPLDHVEANGRAEISALLSQDVVCEPGHPVNLSHLAGARPAQQRLVLWRQLP
jgi:hypothetical protein